MAIPPEVMTSSKHLYTVKIRMFEKTDSLTLDQLETFRTPPELQEKAAKQLRSQNKEFFMILQPVGKLAISASFLDCEIHRS